MTKFKIGRNAITGKFITVARARRNERTAIVETIVIRKKK